MSKRAVVSDDDEASSPIKRPRQEDEEFGDQTQDVSQEEIDELHAQSQLRLGSRSARTQVGVFDSVTLVNFMCHKHLEVTLGPHINFIIGQVSSF